MPERTATPLLPRFPWRPATLSVGDVPRDSDARAGGRSAWLRAPFPEGRPSGTSLRLLRNPVRTP